MNNNGKSVGRGRARVAKVETKIAAPIIETNKKPIDSNNNNIS